MSTKDNGGPAFPAHHEGCDGIGLGMTLRDYFAAKAMQENMREWFRDEDAWSSIETLAIVAYEYADAMLEARKQ